MDNKNKENYIDLSKYNKKVKEDEPVYMEPTFLWQLFKEESDKDPVEKQKAMEARFREARYGGKSNKSVTPPSASFTK